jgi:hypothetical protein
LGQQEWSPDADVAEAGTQGQATQTVAATAISAATTSSLSRTIFTTPTPLQEPCRLPWPRQEPL